MARHVSSMKIAPHSGSGATRTVSVTTDGASQAEIDAAHVALKQVDSAHKQHAASGAAKAGDPAFNVTTSSTVDGAAAPGVGGSYTNVSADAVGKMIEAGIAPILGHHKKALASPT